MSIYIYIYIYIYIIYIYNIYYICIYIRWTRWNGDNTSKNKGICWTCDLQVLKNIWLHFTTDVSYFWPSAELKNNGGERKVCVKWIQFRPWFRPCGAKVSSFIIKKIFHRFSLSFNVSVDVVRTFLSCSLIMNFPWLIKSW